MGGRKRTEESLSAWRIRDQDWEQQKALCEQLVTLMATRLQSPVPMLSSVSMDSALGYHILQPLDNLGVD